MEVGDKMARNKQGSSGQAVNALASTSIGAKQYFCSLPEHVQEMIIKRRENIKSEIQTHRYSDNLTHEKE